MKPASAAPGLIAVVGATATGKTSLAIELAVALGGEIISADSRQVYRGMDIGTAKPSSAQLSAVRHWLIDVADPAEPFSLAHYLDAAEEALTDIVGRGKRPIVCGGTGQYVWALVEGWEVPRVPPDAVLREQLAERADREGVQSLIDELRAIDPVSAERIDSRNVRRVIRAIEVSRATGRPFSDWGKRAYESLPPVIGLSLDRAALHQRIDARVDAMIDAGLVEEVRRLIDAGCTCELPAMSGIGYRQVCEYLAGDSSLDDAIAGIKTETHRLARMQHAWFSPDDARITWLDAGAPGLAQRALAAVATA